MLTHAERWPVNTLYEASDDRQVADDDRVGDAKRLKRQEVVEPQYAVLRAGGGGRAVVGGVDVLTRNES